MYDYILSIKVGDGVNSFYECEIKDRRERILLGGDNIFKDKKGVLSWIADNLPPPFIERLDENKIDVEKVKEEMKK
ncbi:MAG: hypothetical protein KGJ58_04410 [Patescibacteria group bacterium]|nr:hypothetical protein [Patescibacteria group bacterium]MDE1988303.1 hypothetical protein [Patescibacteria group bacterium]MDE2218655.1 hypothetical protein [Patescibacteria group bacterium]